MRFVTKVWAKAQELRRGQTMTEYALILAAIAIVVFVTYEVMGQDIGTLVNKVNSALTTSA
ncbi:MAG TPA: Flp family type IVb pilin [Candidatus Binataceae bacterium]|nr:Flp family type IVb pilin [Candidatus Binataceae bacterium]